MTKRIKVGSVEMGAGAPVRIFELMDDADAIFAGKKERTQDFDDMLNELIVFYEKGYERYLKAADEGYFISDIPTGAKDS